MAYPRRPPSTEPMRQILAYVQALLRSARIIGTSMISGGMGKTELSTKAMPNNARGAFGCTAMRIIQSYRRRIIRAAYPEPTRLSRALRSRQPKRQLHGPEGTAVLGRNPVHGNRRMVLASAVALVALEPVIGVLACEADHDGVARCLGDNRSGRDREALAVASHDGPRPAVEAWRLVAVDQCQLRRGGQPRQRLGHRPRGSVEDVLAVDAIDLGDADADVRGGEDRLMKRAARRVAQPPAVGHPLGNSPRIEDDGGCHHGSGQWPASGLVDAGDRSAMQLNLDRLQLEGRLHLRIALPPQGEIRQFAGACQKRGS